MTDGQDLDPRAAAASKRGTAQLYGAGADDQAAEQSFREALQVAPDFGDAHFHLAIALKPARGEADARILLAGAYEESGDLEKAAVQWRHVAAMEQGDAPVDFAMVTARRKLQKYDL